MGLNFKKFAKVLAGPIGLASVMFEGGKAPKGPAALAKYMQALQAQRYAQGMHYLKGGLQDINTGYGAAMSNAGLGASQAKQDVMSMQAQNLGAQAQQDINKGLYNSTASNTANRGIYSDAMKQMAYVNNTLAQNMAQLNMAKAQALQGAKAGMASYLTGQSGAETSMLQNFWNQMPKQKPGNPLLKAFGQLGGAFLGNYMGGLGMSAGMGGFNGGGGYGQSVLH